MLSISPAFRLKKQQILSALSTPPSTYADLSPKGSIDTGIRDLINQLNQLDGIVTTSSCAGRISVFLEGCKIPQQPADPDDAAAETQPTDTIVPGGKGRGGRWLFVTHEPLSLLERTEAEYLPLHTLFNLTPQSEPAQPSTTPTTRFIRFQFEPMILHIMTATLPHAQPLLAAALNAGFRESGLQSLKALSDPTAFPMVAIRTSGLALSSLIGYIPNYTEKPGQEDDEEGEHIHSLVSEEHLEILVGIANERFLANKVRIERFRREMLAGPGKREVEWEDAETRRERKRAQGLKHREDLLRERAGVKIEERTTP